MPDLINPAFNQGRKEFRIWADELCMSCRVQEGCPFLQAMREHNIMTLFGIHVSQCDLYDPDRESEYYLSPNASDDKLRELDICLLEQKLALLNEKLERFDANTLPR